MPNPSIREGQEDWARENKQIYSQNIYTKFLHQIICRTITIKIFEKLLRKRLKLIIQNDKLNLDY